MQQRPVDRITELSMERSELMGRRLEGWKIRPLTPSEEARLQELDTEIAMASQEQCAEAALKKSKGVDRGIFPEKVLDPLSSEAVLQDQNGNILTSNKGLGPAIKECGLNNVAIGIQSIKECAQASDPAAWGKMTMEQKSHAINAAARKMAEFEPRDATEHAIVKQLLILESNATRYLMIAADQTDARKLDIVMRAHSKLLARHQAMIDALIRYRRSEQKITVQHVQMEAGAQAAFGNFASSPRVGQS